MKKLLAALVIALIATNSVTAVLANNANIQRAAGFVKVFFSQVTEETKETEETEETAGCVEYSTNLGITVCLTSTPISQDLNQCVISANGEILCADICGGRSIPGSVCSFE